MEIRSQAATYSQLEPVNTVPGSKPQSALAGSGQPSQASDVASLSSGQMLSGSDVRVGLVQALQGQISSGTYQVSAQNVANKVMDSMVLQG
ncbi:MAG TPA: flagellar biosynthesis anti-sigma factor FlgM [Granulicella sp.]|jgi:anti-sigma28 factor (negative regulator of flagellin synthesis)|nr:flagellar biosynthesis anti-sigma factor FlgM [Granulicella sp.]